MEKKDFVSNAYFSTGENNINIFGMAIKRKTWFWLAFALFTALTLLAFNQPMPDIASANSKKIWHPAFWINPIEINRDQKLPLLPKGLNAIDVDDKTGRIVVAGQNGRIFYSPGGKRWYPSKLSSPPLYKRQPANLAPGRMPEQAPKAAR